MLYLDNRKIESKSTVNLLEGNYAFNPPNYLLPEISLDPIDLSIFEKEKWIVPSVHFYEEPINSDIKGECKLRVCADRRCYISEIPVSEESYE